MSAWWQKLPSLTPVKGFARFLYVVTHWETISDELKKHDERPKAVEEAMRQLLDLEREKHEAEKAKAAREAERERQRLIAIGGMAIDQALSALDGSHAAFEELREAHADALYAVSVLLAVDQNEKLRNLVLDKLSPKNRDLVSAAIELLRPSVVEARAKLTPPPLRPKEEAR